MSAYEVICHSEDRDEWLKARRLGIGGSDAAAVLGVSPFASPVSLFADKVMGEVQEETEPMEWGKLLEPVILAKFGRETERETHGDGRLLRSTQHPFMQVTLDGLWTLPEREGFVEVKNTRWHLRDGVPEWYWIQIQHQFAVTGMKHGSFAALVMGSEFYWSDVLRDDEFINETLIPQERAFWERVQNGGPTPAPDASEATRKALARIYSQPTGESIELPGDFIADDLRRQEIVQQLSALSTEQQGIDNGIKAALEDAVEGILPNGRTYTWKPRKDGVRVFRAPKVEEEQTS